MKNIDFDKVYKIRDKYFKREFLISKKDMILKVLILTVLIVILIVNLLKNSEKEIEQTLSDGNVLEEELQEDKSYIIVDVSGEVNNPTVVELPIDSRVEDGILAAGGLTEEADVTNINRAEILTDGSKILVPSKNNEQSKPLNGYVTNNQNGNEKKVNINTATSDELRAINGIGPSTAEKIIVYRGENGMYKNIEDLKKVNGIGEKTFEKIKNYIHI